MKRWIAVCLLGLSLSASADVAREAGRMAGRFGTGVTDSIRDRQPSWETVPARSKDDCLKDSGGVLNNAFVRCRNGRQEYVQYNSRGERMVLRERPIPMH